MRCASGALRAMIFCEYMVLRHQTLVHGEESCFIAMPLSLRLRVKLVRQRASL
jgi:DNA-binding cell septation regulator SpoVG